MRLYCNSGKKFPKNSYSSVMGQKAILSNTGQNHSVYQSMDFDLDKERHDTCAG